MSNKNSNEPVNKIKESEMFSSGNTDLFQYLDKKLNETSVSESKEKNIKVTMTNFYSDLLLVDLQKKIINKIDSKYVQANISKEELQSYLNDLMNIVALGETSAITQKERNMVVQSLLDEILGLGPLQNLINDEAITEIMVNSPEQVYVEKHGKLILSDVKFRNNDHVLQIIHKIVSPLGRRVDESSPMVDARLTDGSRVNAIILPLALKGPCITIRKFPSNPLTIEKLISYNSLTDKMANFLENAVAAKCNIIVAGGTGSGKTTFLNVLSSFIPSTERIITIEDAAEIQLHQPHVVSLESRPSNIEDKGEVTIRDLVRNSLRMRPDRIIVGEVRGAEALDMLQAMNTGHNGSLSTIHSNSPRDAITRLTTIVLYSGIDFPIKSIHEQIASAVDLIIYVERFPDGSRKITHITEVLDIEGDRILTQDIFYYEKTGTSYDKNRAEFKKSGIRPRIVDKFIAQGVPIGEW
jgi:pilus assembly protein CpaF